MTLGAILSAGAGAQSEAPAALDIDTANLVAYRHDVFDAARVSTQAGPTTPLPIRTFMHATWIGDVVAVNGTPAKGTVTVRGTYVALNPNPNPGVGVADTTNSLAADWIFDIQREDGSPVGTMMASGWAFGARSVGVSGPGQGNFAVLGGTGVFLGVRGQGKEASSTGSRAAASVTEDPSTRRIHGGTERRFSFQLIPMTRPEFARSTNSLGVFHYSNFSPVTASNPARRAEVLIAEVSGLGATLPGKQPDAPFPDAPLQQVAAPVQVLVNGTAVNASNQVGWPGTLDTYRVDFRVPDDTAAGLATVRLVAAWIPGGAIQVPVQ